MARGSAPVYRPAVNRELIPDQEYPVDQGLAPGWALRLGLEPAPA